MSDIYPIRIEFDEEDNLYVAEFPDLPGCFAPGESVDEAYRRAQDAKDEWMRVAEEQGLPIPPPSRREEYSGRILLRLPAALHGMLADRARNQATSLNQYAVHLLSGAVVGDAVTNQIGRLTRKIASLETQLVKVAKQFEFSYSEITKQLAGTVASSSFSSPAKQKTGGAHEALGSVTSASLSVH